MVGSVQGPIRGLDAEAQRLEGFSQGGEECSHGSRRNDRCLHSREEGMRLDSEEEEEKVHRNQLVIGQEEGEMPEGAPGSAPIARPMSDR